MNKPVMEVKKVSFSAGKKQILKNISFSLLAGEYLSIIGPNGSGKTTLLKCLNRILAYKKGAIMINNKPLDTYRQKTLLN